MLSVNSLGVLGLFQINSRNRVIQHLLRAVWPIRNIHRTLFRRNVSLHRATGIFFSIAVVSLGHLHNETGLVLKLLSLLAETLGVDGTSGYFLH